MTVIYWARNIWDQGSGVKGALARKPCVKTARIRSISPGIYSTSIASTLNLWDRSFEEERDLFSPLRSLFLSFERYPSLFVWNCGETASGILLTISSSDCSGPGEYKQESESRWRDSGGRSSPPPSRFLLFSVRWPGRRRASFSAAIDPRVDSGEQASAGDGEAHGEPSPRRANTSSSIALSSRKYG